jgi:serine/threonine protein kinase
MAMADQTHAFGQYHLTEKIAQGGMAEIFKGKATDAEGLEKTVVIKRILPHIAANPEFVGMLIDEAKIAVQLSHGNVAQIYDLGKVGEDYFIVMEYVDGKSVSQLARKLRSLRRHCPIPIACYIASEIASGLNYVHSKTDEKGASLGIIHRDISPQNIIVSEAGTIKIIDFGIAKAKTKIVTTDSGIVKGKFAYMSPEHAEGDTLDYRTDIFSLGIILYELLTGKRLFKGKNNAETVRRVKRARVSKPSSLRKDIPAELDRIVLKALVKNRNKRYQQSYEMKDDLTKLLVTQYPEFKPDEITELASRIFAEEIPTQMIVMDSRLQKGKPTKIEKIEKPQREDTGIIIKSELQRQLSEFAEDWESSMDSEVSDLKESSNEEKTPHSYSLAQQMTRFAKVSGIVLIGALALLTYRYGPDSWNQISDYLKPMLTDSQANKEAKPKVTSIPVEKPPPVPVKTAKLKVRSIPPGATIYIDEATTDLKTPATLEGLTEKRYEIGLHKEGFQFWEGSIAMEKGEFPPLRAVLKLDFGKLLIDSAPDGADVWLNGYKAGKTPLIRENIPPETLYKVRINKPGFDEFEDEVKIFAGRSIVVNASLKKAEKKEE